MSQHRLFAYGTLQVPQIFAHIVGRALESSPATLPGFACFRLVDRVYPGIVPAAGDRVAGVVYAGLDAGELERLDAYEGELYERQRLRLSTSGGPLEAHGYVLRSEHRHRLSSHAWDLEAFRRDQLASYLACISLTSRAP